MSENNKTTYDDSRERWQALYDQAVESGMDDVAVGLAETGPFPESLIGTPMIIDTDIGDDPDDTVALAIAALHVPELALVITTDEQDGIRARFARDYLDRLGRADVVVVEGAQVRDAATCIDESFVTTAVVEPSRDVIAAVQTLVESTDRPVRWVGMGPMTNLARVAREAPELLDRLVVTQMGFAIDYRRPDRAEHNVHIDIEAARTVLDKVPALTLVLSDVTFTPEVRIGPDTTIYESLARMVEPGSWQELLVRHLDHWFAKAPYDPPGTLQHDPLTLSMAMGLPFVNRMSEHVVLDEIGRMSVDESGKRARMTRSARYEPFMAWVARSLGVEIPAEV